MKEMILYLLVVPLRVCQWRKLQLKLPLKSVAILEKLAAIHLHQTGLENTANTNRSQVVVLLSCYTKRFNR